MKNKNLPLVALLAAILFFFWVKKHQRGSKGRITAESATEAYSALRGDNKTVVYSRHARCRMACRLIDETEVKEILETGTVNFSKIESDGRGKTYPVEGTTHEGQHVRTVFAPQDPNITGVTVLDTETDRKWNCCKGKKEGKREERERESRGGKKK
mgnify:CR=1 FL=1